MMVDHYFICDEAGMPIATDVYSMSRWLTNERRRVAFDEIGKLTVSTAFLGINHQWETGLPILWETMVFGLPDDEEIMDRYTSKADALAGHKRICNEVRALAKGGG